VPNNIGFPISTHNWAANDSTSSWITYANPQLPWFASDQDITGDTYQYQLKFTAASSGEVTVSWLSDNQSSLYLNNSLVGSTPLEGSDGSWTTFNININTGPNTIDLDVINQLGYNQDPTGANVEFSGLTGPFYVSAVPEPTTMIAGALLLLPFGASTLRVLRRNRAAQPVVTLMSDLLMAQKCTKKSYRGIDQAWCL
jgi:hypothetical protein